MASSQPGNRKRKIHHVLDLSNEEDERFGSPTLRCKRRRSLPYDHPQYIPESAILPPPEEQIPQCLWPDPAIEPTVATHENMGARVPCIQNQPRQETSPLGPPQPGPSPYRPSTPGTRSSVTSEKPPRTPFDFVYTNLIDSDFGRKVCDAYRSSIWNHRVREYRYGISVANLWKRGSTPEEARQAYKAKVKRDERAREAMSDTPEEPHRYKRLGPFASPVKDQISQCLPRDSAADPIIASCEDSAACIPSIEHQPIQEISPWPTPPEPSPHESQRSSASEIPPRTPFDFVYLHVYDEDFGRKVCDAYFLSRWDEAWRVARYGESIAREWKRGSTPEEAREAWMAKLEEDERIANELSLTPELEDEQHKQHKQHEQHEPHEQHEQHEQDEQHELHEPHGSRRSSASEIPPRTPFDFVYPFVYDEDFGSKVCNAYIRSKAREVGRAYRYGESVAREWKRGSTPEEAREALRAMFDEESHWLLEDLSPSPVPEHEQHEHRRSSASEILPPTPFDFVYPHDYDEGFGREVCNVYMDSRWREAVRAYRYGKSVAREWKPGRTPEEAREAWRVKSKDEDRIWNDNLSPTPELEDEQHEQHEPQAYIATESGALGSQQPIIAT
ncbi:MAG: hypothetical protein Q9211_002125 [Gyalolechia sp. 1 TL-2023]